MEVKARLEAVNRVDGKTLFALSTEEASTAAELSKLADKDLRIRIVRYRKSRSLNANALFWACVNDIANAVEVDSWTIYIDMLRQYGKSTFICCKPNAVDAVKAGWRESVEIGRVTINGKEAVQMQVFFGSSTYDTEEMSRLIDGTLETMRELDIPLPIPHDIQAALEAWEQMNINHNE